MHSFTKTAVATLAAAALAPAAMAASAYSLTQTYNQTNFFDNFEFFNEPDPTEGFVQYVAAAEANAKSLAGYSEDAVYLGADFSVTNPANGRMSTRVTSKQAYSNGLIIADISHMPYAAGVWPAFWTFGPNWPNSGEIDIIEGANLDTTDHITLHTGPNCKITNTGSATTTKLENGDCNTSSGTVGCSQTTTAPIGSEFNKVGGGVYALDWTSDAIAVYYFARDAIPEDITSETPNPSTWGTPVAKFNGGSGCDIGSVFVNHNIVFNTDFCGEWAGNEWTTIPELTALAATCKDYVAANPSAFSEAYWLINSVKVYSSANKVGRSFIA
ncbi:hypothetical protein TD95_005409 [Thielaviopsis punctulata]|uniref:endo-1,3(4)-beta-glucanase n=1 Tax=Thielaviopsis punctulata TaxID=72032 RepID=A0A0F4ZBD3_9PEZI|nr:hypothetical protein TD95_005409 [Thielaviopsis punctulata]